MRVLRKLCFFGQRGVRSDQHQRTAGAEELLGSGDDPADRVRGNVRHHQVVGAVSQLVHNLHRLRCNVPSRRGRVTGFAQRRTGHVEVVRVVGDAGDYRSGVRPGGGQNCERRDGWGGREAHSGARACQAGDESDRLGSQCIRRGSSELGGFRACGCVERVVDESGAAAREIVVPGAVGGGYVSRIGHHSSVSVPALSVVVPRGDLIGTELSGGNQCGYTVLTARCERVYTYRFTRIGEYRAEPHLDPRRKAAATHVLEDGVPDHDGPSRGG